MVGIIGNRLSRSALITGFGYHPHHYHNRRPHTGHGIARRAIGSVLNTLGHALVNRISGAISGSGRRPRRIYRKRRVTHGSSFKLTGGSYRRRAPVRRIYRKRATVGGYRRTTTHRTTRRTHVTSCARRRPRRLMHRRRIRVVVI